MKAVIAAVKRRFFAGIVNADSIYARTACMKTYGG
jgi:hypothetical protein